MFRMGITIGFAKMKPGRGPRPAPRLEAETAASPVLDQSLRRRRPARKDELVDAVGRSRCGARLLDGFSIRGESRTTPALKVVCQVPQARRAPVAWVTRGGKGKGCVRLKDGDAASRCVALYTLDNRHVQRGPRLRDGVRGRQRDQDRQQQQDAL